MNGIQFAFFLGTDPVSWSTNGEEPNVSRPGGLPWAAITKAGSLASREYDGNPSVFGPGLFINHGPAGKGRLARFFLIT